MVESKAKELAASKEILNSSLEDSLHSKKELEVNVSKLKDDMVVIYNTLFGRTKEKMSLF